MKLFQQIKGLAFISIGIFCAISLRAEISTNQNTIYDSDPKHLWNRLNETLFVRTAQDGKKYGPDELDILFWDDTKYLLEGPSHRKALAILDEFNTPHGEKLIRDPLKRALLQRDLWELFDWSATSWRDAGHVRERRELEQRLAVAIRKLALTKNEIASLPDNYAQAQAKHLSDLPHDMFGTNSDWVSLGINGSELVAPAHVTAFKGHSVFVVMLHLPDGRQSAISYLDKLRSFEHALVYQTNSSTANGPREILELNPDLPQFPTNTEWALVRRMCVIDADGNIQPTPIMESIQLRRYLEIKRGIPDSRILENVVQQFFEFGSDRRHSGALRAVGKNEKGFTFVHFMSMGIDPLEWSKNSEKDQERDSATFQSVRMKNCLACHSARGLFSVNSYTRSFSPPPRPAELTDMGIEREATVTIDWKQRQFDWGLLQGLWANQKL